MNLNAKSRQWADRLFRTYAEDVDVYLQSSHTKGEDYDPAYNIREERTLQNARTVKAMVRDKSSNSLIINKLGLTALGAKSVVVQEMNVSLLKLAYKIIINGTERNLIVRMRTVEMIRNKYRIRFSETPVEVNFNENIRRN